MYPKDEGGYFGIFVKSINENIKLSFDVNEILIEGKSTNSLEKLFKYLFFYLKIIFSLCFKKYKLIYVHFPSYSIPPILFFPFLRNKNIVLNFHGSDIMLNSKLNLLFIKYFKLIKSCVKLIIVPSSHLGNEVVKKLNFNEIFVSASGGISNSYYDLDLPKLGKSQNLKFVYISSLIESKGIFNLLDSVEQLYLNSEIEIDLTIYGSGNTNILQKKIDKYDNIKFMGVADNKRLPYIFNDFDVLVFPSKRESLGLIGLEALACGIPVIASDIPGVNSYVKHNHNGLLFELENNFDLMNKIEFLLNNPAEYERLRLNSRSSVLNFKKSIIADNLNKKISEII